LRLFKGLYLSYGFFLVLLLLAITFAAGFAWPIVFIVAQGALALVLAIMFLEIFVLFVKKRPVTGSRHVITPLSMGDENKVTIRVTNKFPFPVRILVYDNAPIQLQLRNLHFSDFCGSQVTKEFSYRIRPTERGEFHFHDIHAFVSVLTHFIQRRVIIQQKQMAGSYPSIIQMKKYELRVFAKTAITGIKKIRRLGHNNEFEQIKNYVQGDDLRKINWKATSRKNELMVNQYQDERAQNVYMILDKSRSMRMPFNELTLLDHSINSTLAFANVCIRKGDKVGMITFSDKLGSKIAADRTSRHMTRIMELLYRQKTRFLEANFEMLFQTIRNHVKGRSLLMLFTNIESEYSMKRILPLLRRINQLHVLVVIFFENTEVEKTAQMKPKHVRDIYLKTFAEKYAMDKKKISFELRKHGIQTILTKPENLTIDTINKYIELKAKGVI